MLNLPDTHPLETCINHISKHHEAANLAFTHIDEEDAWRQFQELQRSSLKTQPNGSPPLAGVVATVKACIDVKGWITHAGSAALLEIAPAQNDAALVTRLREQGAVILAQTNMTEFAYGALGVNRHFGTPRTPLYRDGSRVAGGSSSGAAVSVALGFADIALCSDTSGSARIPAAFCGVVGFMPTRGRWPTQGFFPLSPSFDVPGLMTSSMLACRRVFIALDEASIDNEGQPSRPVSSALTEHRTRRLCVPVNIFQDQPMSKSVHRTFETAIQQLEAKGWAIEHRNIESLTNMSAIVAEAGIIAADAYSVHRKLLEKRGQFYDPLIRARIAAGAEHRAWRYSQAHQELHKRACQYEDSLSDFDAMLTPATPILPPKVVALEDPDNYLRLNRRVFAYTEIANRLGKPSITVPFPSYHNPGVGLLLTGKAHHDQDLIELAAAMEAAFEPHIN